MAETKITYGADTALTVAAWTTTLLATEAATSSVFANGTSAFMDVLIGGEIATAVTPVAGDSWDIYVVGEYSDTVTDMNGGIGTAFAAAGEVVEDTAFVLANSTLMKSISPRSTTPGTALTYHWGPISVAQFFGGVMPKNFMLLLHNNTAAALSALATVNTIGVTYTTA